MMRRRVWWMVVMLVIASATWASAYSSNYCEQLKYVQGGLTRFQVGVEFSVALSSNPGADIASTVTDNNGWGCLCLSQSRNYHVNRGGVVSPDEFIAVADLVGVGQCASNATPTPTVVATPTRTATPTPGAATSTPSPSATATPSGCTNTIQQTGVVGDYWTVYGDLGLAGKRCIGGTNDGTACTANSQCNSNACSGGNTNHAKQRINNATSRSLPQITLCLGKGQVTGGYDSRGNGTGKLHAEIYSDEVVAQGGSCGNSEPYCPGTILTNGTSTSIPNSFPYVGCENDGPGACNETLCTGSSCPGNLACGDPGKDRGRPVTFTFPTPPTVTGNFWIVLHGDSGADTMTGGPRWATYLVGNETQHPQACSEPDCSLYGGWRGGKVSSDYWFQVCTQ